MDKEKSGWTNTELHHLYKLTASRQTLLNAEAAGTIPQAKRIPRGSSYIRMWGVADLPVIGAKYGFLKKCQKQIILSIYTAKGGVLKTTLSYNLARILALHGMQVLIIGLDSQGSITDLALRPLSQLENLEEFNSYSGLYDVFQGDVTLNEAIIRTSLPTLDIIPETPSLVLLDRKIKDMRHREAVLKEKVVEPLLAKYDVIIFDNGPSWNMLIENSLYASNAVVSPLGCDLGSYQAVQVNLDNTFLFRDEMKLTWDQFLMVPTLLENNKISKQIYGAYLQTYAEMVINSSIRRTAKGQETLTFGQSILETDPKSALADDYRKVVSEIWSYLA